MRAALYIRTPPAGQEGPSAEDQRMVLEDQCLAEGWDVAAVYEDIGVSGRDNKRPGYIRMMAEMDNWDVLMVARISIVHTTQMNYAMLLRRLEREGKAFVSVSGPEDHLEDTESRRAAVYIRVSTEEQAMEGYSLGAQEALLREFCVSQGWAVHQVYIDDGYSGRNDNRPSYRRMMEEIGDWDVLLVMKMDRIHRNFRNFMTMMETLERNGKKFASVNENLDTSNAVGRFATDIIMRIAQLESEQTGERTYMGMREKAETLEKADSGKRTMGFTPPFGYALEGGKLVAVPEELSVVSRIFSMYLGGTTMEMICYELNSSGELTRKGNPWNKFNLRNVLHNPVYAGYMRWEDVLIHHDAGNAVSPEDYNAVQELMVSRVRDPSKRTVFLVPVLRLRTIVY